MHALLEFLPLVGLGGGYFIGKSINPEQAMYYLSYGAIIGTIIQFAIYKITRQKMQKTTLITGWLLIIFATMTVVFQNDLFVKLKPTALSWAFAIAFWGYAFVKKTTLLEVMMAGQFEMPASKWLTLNWAWIIFNIAVGLANLVIIWQIHNGVFTNDAWVNFKIALLPISFVFVIGQTVYLMKNGIMTHDAEKGSVNNKDHRIM